MKTTNFSEEVRELVAGSMVIANRITVVNVASSTELRAVAAYIQKEYRENILIIQDKQYAAFYSGEIEANNFSHIILDDEDWAMPTDCGFWEIRFRLKKPYQEFLDLIKDKLLSQALILSAVPDFRTLDDDISLLNSGFANDIREGFNLGMKEAQEVLYKLFCFSSILQNSLRKAQYNPKNFRDKMALTLLKKEIEEFIQSKNYLLCVEMTNAGVSRVVSRHCQNYVQRLLTALEEIVK